MRRWRQELLPPLLVALTTRAALFLAVWVSLRAVPRLPFYPAQLPDDFLPDHPLLDGWARWDAAHYIAIADLGYGAAESPSPNGGYGFLPVFPLLLRGLGALPGMEPDAGTYAVLAIVLANCCFALALGLFVALSRAVVSRQATMNGVLLLCLAPFSFFFSAAYSESLFLALCLSALLLGERNRWVAGGMVGAIASATRIAGLALAPAMFYGAYRAGVRGWRLAAAGLLPLTGFALWSLYTWWKIGDARAYFHSQAEWGGWEEHVRFYAKLLVHEPMTMLRGDPRHLVILLNIALGLLFLALLPRVWRLTPPAVAMFTVVIVVFHAGWTWVSLGRYLLPAVGVFIAGGELLARPRLSGWPRDAVYAVCAIGLTALAILFAHGFWVV
jgi:hypothetical protein